MFQILILNIIAATKIDYDNMIMDGAVDSCIVSQQVTKTALRHQNQNRVGDYVSPSFYTQIVTAVLY